MVSRVSQERSRLAAVVVLVGVGRRGRRARRPRDRLAPGVAGLGRAGLVPRAARPRLQRASPASPRTGSTTRETRTTRSGVSSRRSSRHSRAPTRSWWRSIFVVSGRPFALVVGGSSASLLYVGLLYTHTRAAVRRARGRARRAGRSAQRRLAPAVLAAVVDRCRCGVPHRPTRTIGPSTSYTQEELELLRENAASRTRAQAPIRSRRLGVVALESHWRNLRDGMRGGVRSSAGTRAR